MKSGVVVLDNKKKKKPIFNPDLKNTMSSVVGGAGEASASAGTGAVMASVDNNMFLNFLNNLKTPENVSLIESIKSGFNPTKMGIWEINCIIEIGCVQKVRLQDVNKSSL